MYVHGNRFLHTGHSLYEESKRGGLQWLSSLRKINIILQNASWDDFFNLFFSENSTFDIDVDLCEMTRGVYSGKSVSRFFAEKL